MVVSKLPPAKVVRAIETVRYRVGQLHRRMLPAPAVMMEMITGGWCAQAITAAADLGIADAVAKGPLTAHELAAAVDACRYRQSTAAGIDLARHLSSASRWPI